VREEDIAKIIQNHLVIKPDIDAAESQMLAVDGLARFHASLKTSKEKEDFRKHVRRYMSIYLPDCPFEVNSTNRYTIVSHEASITARRFIRKNETIKYLCGIQVVITAREEEEIAKRKKDFSIVVSSRSKCTSLFMGPARFANHDCDANAKLMTTGQGGMEVVATKDIEAGDEITVTYGENYFGEDNCECLCRTCEDSLVNGWASEDGQVRVKPSIEQDSLQGYSLRRRRRDGSTRESSRTPSVTPDIRPRVWKTRSRSGRFDNVHATNSPSAERSSHLKRPISALATPPFTPSKKQKVMAAEATEPIPISLISPPSDMTSDATSDDATDRTSRGGSSSSISNDAAALTDATSVGNDSPHLGAKEVEVMLKVEEVGVSVDGTTTTTSLASDLYPSPSTTPPTSRQAGQVVVQVEEVEQVVTPPAAAMAMSVEVGNSEVEDSPQPLKKRKYQRRTFVKQGTPPPVKSRVPGDYTLTPLLLAEPEMAWVSCTNCSTTFVQQNAYYTRSSCPRCERHSKLYGYVWPKTEKAGARDREERIMDHRTIHRFLDAEAEAMARGRKPPVWAMKQQKDDEDEEEEAVAVRAQRVFVNDDAGLRRSGRVRRTSMRLAA